MKIFTKIITIRQFYSCRSMKITAELIVQESINIVTLPQPQMSPYPPRYVLGGESHRGGG